MLGNAVGDVYHKLTIIKGPYVRRLLPTQTLFYRIAFLL